MFLILETLDGLKFVQNCKYVRRGAHQIYRPIWRGIRPPSAPLDETTDTTHEFRAYQLAGEEDGVPIYREI